MRFSILGPFEVHDGEAPVTLGGGQQRKLLAILLLHANEVVSSDHLIEDLWGSRPPSTAVKALQGYISQLRKRLGQTTVETVGSGYRVRVEPEDLDVRQFERLLADARLLDRPAAAAQLRRALALWRGPPLADFSYDEFAQNEISRLDELRLACIERKIDLELALGHHDDVVPELEAHVRDYPLRERLRRHLMVALYRSGRQADALEAYRDARIALRDELGLEPSAELQTLQKAILEHDPTLAAPPRVELPHSELATAAARRRPRPGTLVALGAVILLLAAAAGTAIALTRGGKSEPILVAPNSVAMISGSRNRVVSYVGVGRRPVGVAVGESGVWVTSADDGTVSRLDPNTGKLVRTIGVGTDVNAVATGFGSVWIADGNDATLTRIDPKLNQIERTLTPSVAPILATNPIFFVATDNRYVWATQGDQLLRIDPTTNQVGGRLTVGAATALATGGGSVWVTTVSERLFRVNARTLRVTASALLNDAAIAAAYGDGLLWLIVRGVVDRVDPITLATAPVPTSVPDPIVVADAAGSVWIGNSDGVLERLSTSTGDSVATLRIGPGLTAVAAAAGRVWVTVAGST